MFRTLDIIMIVALLAGATWTFKVKSDADMAGQEVARLERLLQIEREAIDILEADWSLLTSPDRLENLAKRHEEELQLQQTDPRQIATFDEIPDWSDLEIAEDDELREAADETGAVDTQTLTGSVPTAETVGSNAMEQAE